MKILSMERLRESTIGYDDYASIALSDHARYIYSAAFRRLQMKAQVFSLESNAAVRSRLTHSIEVAHIGDFLVQKFVEIIKDRKEKGLAISNEYLFFYENEISVRKVVQTACLIHDVGNPPFGHFGESAICAWFKDYILAQDNHLGESCKRSFSLKDIDVNYNDFLYFDGNPQGLRIISKLQGNDGYGLNLSTSQIAACIKYIASNSQVGGDGIFKKMGYFSTEEGVVKAVHSDLGITDRHVLVYLMEAADDISYCISDIEDGLEKGVVSYSTFFKYVFKRINEVFSLFGEQFLPCKEKENIESCLNRINKLFRDVDSDIDSEEYPDIFLKLKTNITNLSVKMVASEIHSRFDELILGKRDAIICEETPVYALQEVLKSFTRKYIFSSHEAENMELGGYAIIYGLLDKFKVLLDMPRQQFSDAINKQKNKDVSKVSCHLINLLPDKHRKAYLKAVSIDGVSDEKEFNLRCHLVVDYISGMTDSYAMEIYQLLNGIKVK